MKNVRAAIFELNNWKKKLKRVCFYFFLITFCSCSDSTRKSKNSDYSANPAPELSSDTQTQQIGSNPSEPVSSWSYHDVEDKMTSKKIEFASITANEELQFDFPYDGGAIATFTIRKKNGSTDIYLQVSKGQFNNTFEGGMIKIRFDNNPAKKYSYAGASDGSSDIIFINSVREVVNKIKSSKKMIIEAEFYNEGNRQIEFSIEQLKWE